MTTHTMKNFAGPAQTNYKGETGHMALCPSAEHSRGECNYFLLTVLLTYGQLCLWTNIFMTGGQLPGGFDHIPPH